MLALVGARGVARHDKETRHLRQVSNDVFGNAVTEVLLLGIATHVNEGKNSDGWFLFPVRSGAVAAIAAGRWVQGNVVNANWPFDVLEPPLAHVLESEIQSVADMIAHRLGDCDPALRGAAFQSRRH